MQDSLFPEVEPAAVVAVAPPPRKRGKDVEPAAPSPSLSALRAALPARLRLGTSSWNYPGWVGSVWAQEYPETTLSRKGLRAYAQHPLLRTVSLDRAFYRPLDAGQYAAYAAQVPDDFRFVVKAPSVVADALVRSENGRGLELNPRFLDPRLAVHASAEPASEGLGHKLGVLVFQLSPLPDEMLMHDRAGLLQRLAAMLQGLAELRAQVPDVIVAVEVRNAAWLGPDFVAVLRASGATYCLGLHAKMPAIGEQLPILRALWPGPLVCRWNLHRRHGAYGYEEAKRLYGAFDRIVDADPETRAALARVIRGTTGAGWPAYVTIGNKAEGSAPLTAAALAEAIAAAA
ncbi:DUF72 domain-containing protein [Solimonas soli]|uniref:DUF72 domain-containing protein n=1 Tax=Solimonas soli TaxID=413479 RepID=UPI000481E6AD|nr:DUF72 domain-containing protein [Solimonas soli]